MKVFSFSAIGKPKASSHKEYSRLAAEDSVWQFMVPGGDGWNGTPFKGKWKVQTFYIEKPMVPKPNFFWIGGAVFVCDEVVRELAGEPLEMCGEFLPIRVEGQKAKFWIYNITNTTNVLDHKKSKWERIGPDSDDVLLEKPAFISSRFGEETIFKIQEDRGSSMYCIELLNSWEDGEFKAIVEHFRLTGLTFELVWSGK
jgi:hypothetical protein